MAVMQTMETPLDLRMHASLGCATEEIACTFTESQPPALRNLKALSQLLGSKHACRSNSDPFQCEWFLLN